MSVGVGARRAVDPTTRMTGLSLSTRTSTATTSTLREAEMELWGLEAAVVRRTGNPCRPAANLTRPPTDSSSPPSYSINSLGGAKSVRCPSTIKKDTSQRHYEGRQPNDTHYIGTSVYIVILTGRKEVLPSA